MPAANEARLLATALVNQETGVRGYLLSGKPQFLQPYRVGAAETEQLLSQLRSGLRDDTSSLAAVDQVEAAYRSWLTETAQPEIA
ncbi:MAG: CHASE3 domain-containing protein, partial [Acidimicrobiales bacterium]